MIGIIIRLLFILVPVAVIAHVATKHVLAQRKRKQLSAKEKELLALKESIVAEIRAVQAGFDEGIYSSAETDKLTADIYDKCRNQGIDVPQPPTKGFK